MNLKNRTKDADGNSVYTYIDKEIPEDTYLLAALTPYYEQVEAKLSEVIGVADGFFNNENIRLNPVFTPISISASMPDLDLSRGFWLSSL